MWFAPISNGDALKAALEWCEENNIPFTKLTVHDTYGEHTGLAFSTEEYLKRSRLGGWEIPSPVKDLIYIHAREDR